jgi:hypothetical protein
MKDRGRQDNCSNGLSAICKKEADKKKDQDHEPKRIFLHLIQAILVLLIAGIVREAE